jgi:peptidoglycan/xylan/chitin deacetylase (PgdA/CDA1 family)
MISRRAFLGAGALAALGAVVAACGGDDGRARSSTTAAPTTPPTTPAGSQATSPPTTPPATGPAKFVDAGPATKARVALTFHTDGDLALAQQYLDVLAQRNVHVTCFVVGKWLDVNPTWATKLTAAGHELANHTYNHLTFDQLPPAQMADEIVRCRDLLVRLTGKPGKYFRPSGTDDGTTTPPAAVLQAAGEAGYGTVLGFDVDPLDYTDPGAAAVTQRTLAAIKAGSIVSLHFNHPGTLAALPGILDGLAQKNLTPVTVSELLA